ncbi:MAG: hypothetical protein JSW07_09980, partial [bacterium]
MAEKVKISKKEVKFLREDIDLDPDVVEMLAKLQEKRQKKFQDRIETRRKEALERYAAQIKALEEAKEETMKQYNNDIKKYEELVEGLKKQRKVVKQKQEKK